jgi:hypothetical protein
MKSSRREFIQGLATSISALVLGRRANVPPIPEVEMRQQDVIYVIGARQLSDTVGYELIWPSEHKTLGDWMVGSKEPITIELVGYWVDTS